MLPIAQLGSTSASAITLGPHVLSGRAILAPMSGITDLGMRRLAQRFGASMVVSEMVDGDFLAAGEAGSVVKADGAGLACHVVQIAGCQAPRLAEAARVAVDHGAAVVDINMGCPAKKVVGGFGGSALMRDLDHATALIRAVVAAVRVPVTVKMRLGWDEQAINAPDLARRAEAEGVAMVSVHGRTRSQFYKGIADWDAIRAVKDAVGVPVVANGDCTSPAEAATMLERSGADAVMIGRAALGRPWLVGAVARHLAGEPAALPGMEVRRDAALEHYDLMLTLYGVERGVRHARKHLAAYALHAGCDTASDAAQALVMGDSPRVVRRLLAAIFDETKTHREAA